jgi:hypothetical protein
LYQSNKDIEMTLRWSSLTDAQAIRLAVKYARLKRQVPGFSVQLHRSKELIQMLQHTLSGLRWLVAPSLKILEIFDYVTQ